MITCRDFVELLMDHHAGELPAERRAHVDNHLGACPSCVAYSDSYRVTMLMARQLPLAEVPPQLYERFQTALQQGSQGA